MLVRSGYAVRASGMPKADRLSPGAVRLLKERHLAHFATLMPDGAPQVTPVWIDVEDDGQHVLVNTALGRVKDLNAARDTRVALSVNDAADFYRCVVVRGHIVERRTDGAEEHYAELGERYLGGIRTPRRQPGEQRVILRIKPDSVTEHGV